MMQPMEWRSVISPLRPIYGGLFDEPFSPTTYPPEAYLPPPPDPLLDPLPPLLIPDEGLLPVGPVEEPALPALDLVIPLLDSGVRI
jgi:hypothetical protein